MVFEWKIDGRKWPFIFVSGEATSIKREEVGAPLGACSPLGLAAPLSYKRRRWRPLSKIAHSLPFSLIPFGWYFSPCLLHFSDTVLRRSPVQFLTPPPPPCRSAAGGSRGSTTSAANWSKGRRSSPYRTCDRLRRCCPFVAPRHQAAKFFATLRSGENTLHHPRLFAGTFFPLPVFEGEYSQNRYE